MGNGIRILTLIFSKKNYVETPFVQVRMCVINVFSLRPPPLPDFGACASEEAGARGRAQGPCASVADEDPWALRTARWGRGEFWHWHPVGCRHPRPHGHKEPQLLTGPTERILVSGWECGKDPRQG